MPSTEISSISDMIWSIRYTLSAASNTVSPTLTVRPDVSYPSDTAIVNKYEPPSGIVPFSYPFTDVTLYPAFCGNKTANPSDSHFAQYSRAPVEPAGISRTGFPVYPGLSYHPRNFTFPLTGVGRITVSST